MLRVDFDIVFLIYISLGLLLIFGLWFFYDQREVAPYKEARKEASFLCVKCGHLYTGARTEAKVACPKCRFQNARLKF